MEDKTYPEPDKEDVVGWLTEHGDALYRYALKRVGKADTAEDLVQETFLAAIRSANDFERRSKLQTWLIGILRHKIADHLRKLSRQRAKEAEAFEASQAGGIFQNGHWQIGLHSWPTDPSSWMENQEFWQVLDECQTKLPAKLATVFRMRDLEELSMSDICETLEITATNLSVRLHRARILLRECLDLNWFSARRKP
jgi:RNA polymerase sigma-70 factor (ECF subfamily)